MEMSGQILNMLGSCVRPLPHSELEIFQQQTSQLPFICTCWNPVSSQESSTSFLFIAKVRRPPLLPLV